MRGQDKFTLFITTNGSGEISTWVKPIVRAARARRPDWRVVVALMPYRHATGGEEAVLAGIPEIDGILNAAETKRLFLRSTWPGRLGFDRPGRGVLLFLGGDQFFAGLLAKKMGLPAAAYIQETARWPKLYQLFFAPRGQVLARLKKARIPAEKIVPSGDLVTEAVWQALNETLGWDGEPIELPELKKICRVRLHIPDDRTVVVYMPGSNISWYRFVTPELIGAADRVMKRLPQVDSYLMVSPFIPPQQREVTVPPMRKNPTGRWQMGATDSRGTNLSSGPAPDLMAAADLLVTVPGTKTAEAAALGTPLLVFLPLNRPDLIPLDGLLGLIAGSRFFKFIWPGLIAAAQLIKKLLALPNIYAGREIAPELVGKLDDKIVADRVIQILEDQPRLRLMRQQLPVTMGQPGAASLIIEALGRSAAGQGTGNA